MSNLPSIQQNYYNHPPDGPRGKMSSYETITVDTADGVARVALNRSEVRNAFDDRMVAELTDAFHAIEDDDDAKVIILTGAGDAFSAGADLNWMKRMATYTFDENVADSTAMGRMFGVIHGCEKPVIGRINGPAVGGGVGLVAAVDIAIASEKARFRFSEVKLGLVPAVISPFVIERIGPARARPLFISGDWIDAERARDIGLVDAVVPHDLLDRAVDDMISKLRSSAPLAMGHAKDLVQMVVDGRDREDFAIMIAELRDSEEGREGISAFLEKRKPEWRW